MDTKKSSGFARTAHDRYPYAWIDTCCINKESSAELSEAINSMFAWYQNAGICYAYLDDVVQEGGSGIIPDGVGNSKFRLYAELRESKWFTRWWTLQELIAPRVLLMLNVDWVDIGYKRDLCYILHSVTGIDETMLRGTAKLESFSIAKRMSWAADRQTTRPEDIAYSLMGIFNVNLPLIYGEGDNAFLRLQEEIIRNSDDHSIFAWEETRFRSTTQAAFSHVHQQISSSRPISFLLRCRACRST